LRRGKDPRSRKKNIPVPDSQPWQWEILVQFRIIIVTIAHWPEFKTYVIFHAVSINSRMVHITNCNCKFFLILIFYRYYCMCCELLCMSASTGTGTTDVWFNFLLSIVLLIFIFFTRCDLFPNSFLWCQFTVILSSFSTPKYSSL
jgi:hypothetical protein